MIGEGALPAGWASCPLSILAEVGAGNAAPQGKDKFKVDGIPFVRVQDMGRLAGRKYLRNPIDKVNDKGAVGLRMFPKGTVLLTKSGASTLLNQRAILGEESYVVSHIATVQASAATLPEWLYYFLLTVDAGLLAHGGNMPSLPLSRVSQINTPLPPFNEQRRIVDKIETLFARLDKGEEALRDAQKLLARYRQSVLKSAFSGRLTAKWRVENAHRRESGEQLLARILKNRRAIWKGRGKYQDPTTSDITNLPDLPEGWVWASVEQLSSSEANALCIGPFGSNLKVEDYRDQGIPLVFVRHIRAKDFAGQNLKFIDVEKSKELSSHRVYPGDILITKMGDPPGDICIYPEGASIAIITADCIRFAVSKAGIVREFVAMAMESRPVQAQIHLISKGVAQQKVNLANFRRVAIPLPSCEEQAEIASLVDEHMSKISQLEEWCQTELTRSAALRQSILKDAFAGRLVPQDPADEPAAALLARIRAARATAPKRGRKGTVA